VLDPIETAGLSLKDVPQLRERVRELIDDARRGLQAELGVAPARAAQMA
jgi:hypothetical protein